jgi:GntR family transcriptional repressor for pyruvate dehydrogenase complex
VAELAAVRSSAADLIQLQDVLNSSNEHLSPEEALRLDIQFHTILAQAARNQLMATVLTLTSSWTADVRLRSHSTIEGRRCSIEGHRHILAAIESRDATAAGIAMRDHLATSPSSSGAINDTASLSFCRSTRPRTPVTTA